MFIVVQLRVDSQTQILSWRYRLQWVSMDSICRLDN